jgi:deoxyadenosine/deoxycytidine kinase
MLKWNNKTIYIFGILYLVSRIYAGPTYFFVEGITGVGKTTFMQLLVKGISNAAAIYEPIEKFTNVNGAGNILTHFFSDQKRWGFTTECYIALMHTKAIEDHAKGSSATVVFVDGSMYADCYVFGKMALRLETMNLLEWEIYKQIISWISKNTVVKSNGFIYLQTNPQVALERVYKRNRDGEKEVSLQYETILNDYYQEWFIEKKCIPGELAQTPVLIIDATQNFKDDPIIQQQCIQQVKDFIWYCTK